MLAMVALAVMTKRDPVWPVLARRELSGTSAPKESVRPVDVYGFRRRSGTFRAQALGGESYLSGSAPAHLTQRKRVAAAFRRGGALAGGAG